MVTQPSIQQKPQETHWHEVYRGSGQLRPMYQNFIERFEQHRPSELQALDERMEATLREMGVTFDVNRDAPWGRQPWACDILPQLFLPQEWKQITDGFRQRLKAFELFLQDVYGKKEILRQGVIPILPVLGSPQYQKACIGIPRSQNVFLHLSGICLSRDLEGNLIVKNHRFGHASGISYMIQNRRVLARVVPENFHDISVESLAETPLAILEKLHELSDCTQSEPLVVLLTPGPGSSVYSEHSFLARRMGIPLVQGGDLLVLNDQVYLKTVHGLERVEIIYSRVADDWLDPLVFRRNSRIGVPGLVHCLRKGTVALINSIGSLLADDRSLLCFANKIIRFYLAEKPILPALSTYWLGDIDQQEMVLDNLSKYRIRRLFGETAMGAWPGIVRSAEEEIQLREQLRKTPHHFIAQSVEEGATTICFHKGKKVTRTQDHILFAVRKNNDFEVFPGALTRVSSGKGPVMTPEFGGTSKDSWVLSDLRESAAIKITSRPFRELNLPSRQVTSRVAESFYWMGRYLERANNQAYLIQVVETLEMEELNSAERKLYRPMWNRLLPPLEKSARSGKRSISNRLDRYRLVLQPDPGSVVKTFSKAFSNAESIQECLSPETWAILSNLRLIFQKNKFRPTLRETECARTTRKLSDAVTQMIPQFFATAENSMLADDGWRFCEIGQMLERAIISGNAVNAIIKPLTQQITMINGMAPSVEIELSAFLRLLGSRDAYRRVYQMRADPVHVLEILWQNPQAPKSVLRCIQKCATWLRESAPLEAMGTSKTLAAMESFIQKLKRLDWSEYFVPAAFDEDSPLERSERNETTHQSEVLSAILSELMNRTLEIHDLICDAFLNHQAYIANSSQIS